MEVNDTLGFYNEEEIGCEAGEGEVDYIEELDHLGEVSISKKIWTSSLQKLSQGSTIGQPHRLTCGWRNIRSRAVGTVFPEVVAGGSKKLAPFRELSFSFHFPFNGLLCSTLWRGFQILKGS